MPIANCKRCGRIYNRISRDICPACIKQEDEMLIEIRRYLKQHSEASITDVSEGTGVEYTILVEMIRDGRLMIHNHPNLKYPCERCGMPTQSGRLCAKCAKELAQELKGVRAQLVEKNGNEKLGKGYYSR